VHTCLQDVQAVVRHLRMACINVRVIEQSVTETGVRLPPENTVEVLGCNLRGGGTHTALSGREFKSPARMSGRRRRDCSISVSSEAT
jgi:hypothetical protein